MGKIQTFSIVIGTRACNAGCPFCVSSMTGFGELPKKRAMNEINLRAACRLAQSSGCTTVLFTGKGEPTLYPDEISDYLSLLMPHEFPLIELQTNALAIGRLARDGESGCKLTKTHLDDWRRMGLNTMAISTVGVNPTLNAEIYDKDYPPLEDTVAYLRAKGFTVRLCVMMMRGGVQNPARLAETIHWCRTHDVGQLKIQTLRKPAQTEDGEASSFVAEHALDDISMSGLHAFLAGEGTVIMRLMHGAVVYDVGGQNVCLTDCLTPNPGDDSIRTLIYYANGLLTHSWDLHGAVLLQGRDAEPPLAQLRKK